MAPVNSDPTARVSTLTTLSPSLYRATLKMKETLWSHNTKALDSIVVKNTASARGNPMPPPLYE